MIDVRLLSLLLSFAFALAVILDAVDAIGKENLLTSTRTGCGLKSDLWRAFADPEHATLGSSATSSTSTDASSMGPASGAGGCSGGTVDVSSASRCSPTSVTSVEHVESGLSGRSCVCVVGNWKETRRLLGAGGDSRRDTPSTGTCGPTGPGGAGGSGSVDWGRSGPIIRTGVGVPGGRGDTSGDEGGGDGWMGLRSEDMKRVRRRVDVVGAVLIGLGGDEIGRYDLGGGGGAE